LNTYSGLEINFLNNIFEDLDFIVDTNGIQIYDNSSIISIENRLEINIYPNPFSEIINIEYYSEDDEVQQIYLYDEQGRLLESIENIERKSTCTISFNSLDLMNGIYILKIKSREKTFLKKLILTK